VVNAAYDLYVFEDRRLQPMTKRPTAKQDAQGRLLPDGRRAKAGLHRAMLGSAWGQVVAFSRYKALRRGQLVITVPPVHSSQACAVCTFTAPDHRRTPAGFVGQRCGHTDHADHNAAMVIKKRGIHKLLSGDPLTKSHKTTRIVRTLGLERSEVTPGEISVSRLGPTVPAPRSRSQEPPGAIQETPTSTRQG